MKTITTRSSRWLVFSAALLASRSAAWAQAPVDEAAAVRQVCAASPGAAAARALRLRGESAITAAAVLPNPELIAEHDRILTGEDDHETTVGLAVSLGIGGRRF